MLIDCQSQNMSCVSLSRVCMQKMSIRAESHSMHVMYDMCRPNELSQWAGQLHNKGVNRRLK